MSEITPEIKSVDALLNMKLSLPSYQRPYKWTVKNVSELIKDMNTAIDEPGKYRIGTVILHRNGSLFDIVDGQQRILTLILLCLCINKDNFSCSLLEQKITDKISHENISKNYKYIRSRISALDDVRKKSLFTSLNSKFEFVVITVSDLSTAFQLFDSQNTRGKELEPHDLLKAYHLRAMAENPYDMQHAVTKWESHPDKDISLLFDSYLFPAFNWSKRLKTRTFTTNEIDAYKGIAPQKLYTYALRARNAMPYFQITEPFIEGEDFFNMVSHYIEMLSDVKKEAHNIISINSILANADYASSTGFQYTLKLFYCALLCYYDRFHNFNRRVVYKLFVWAMMLRIDMETLGFDSINRYAIGENTNSRYSNGIPMFALITSARTEDDIADIDISTNIAKERTLPENWQKLYNTLCGMI